MVPIMGLMMSGRLVIFGTTSAGTVWGICFTIHFPEKAGVACLVAIPPFWRASITSENFMLLWF